MGRRERRVRRRRSRDRTRMRTSRTPGVKPAASALRSTWRPAMWCGASARSQLPGPPRRACVARADAVRVFGVCCAPFGMPVVPDVEMTSETASSIGEPAPRASARCAAWTGSAAGTGSAAVRSAGGGAASTMRRSCSRSCRTVSSAGRGSGRRMRVTVEKLLRLAVAARRRIEGMVVERPAA